MHLDITSVSIGWVYLMAKLKAWLISKKSSTFFKYLFKIQNIFLKLMIASSRDKNITIKQLLYTNIKIHVEMDPNIPHGAVRRCPHRDPITLLLHYRHFS